MNSKKELLKILDTFGMSRKKCANILEITYGSLYNMLNDNMNTHNIRDHHVEKLKAYIVLHAEKFKSISSSVQD